MVLYSTFKGFNNNPTQYKWIKSNNELGESMGDELVSNSEVKLMDFKLKFGNRYRVECEKIIGNVVFNIRKIKQVNKNPRCDIFRRFKDEFHMIGGKYKGKKDSDIDSVKMIKYCIWLASNTINEATINNCLLILKKNNE